MSEYPYAATLTPEKIKAYVAAIAARANEDPEAAHGMEDDLYREVLTAIATSTVAGVDALLCALYALGTRDIDFERWCA